MLSPGLIDVCILLAEIQVKLSWVEVKSLFMDNIKIQLHIQCAYYGSPACIIVYGYVQLYTHNNRVYYIFLYSTCGNTAKFYLREMTFTCSREAQDLGNNCSKFVVYV